MTTETPPRFDEIERHPDDAVTAYTHLRGQFLGEPMPDDLEAMAERPLPEAV